MNELKLYEHVTDGGAIYLTTIENDLHTAIVRLDGEPLLILNDNVLKQALAINNPEEK